MDPSRRPSIMSDQPDITLPVTPESDMYAFGMLAYQVRALIRFSASSVLSAHYLYILLYSDIYERQALPQRETRCLCRRACYPRHAPPPPLPRGVPRAERRDVVSHRAVLGCGLYEATCVLLLLFSHYYYHFILRPHHLSPYYPPYHSSFFFFGKNCTPYSRYSDN